MNGKHVSFRSCKALRIYELPFLSELNPCDTWWSFREMFGEIEMSRRDF